MESFRKYSLVLPGGRLFSIERPLVMGIINITPDSFYRGSRIADTAQLEERVATMLNEGVDIIDVGACSTRPGAPMVNANQEQERLAWAVPKIKSLLTRYDGATVLLSIDTFRSSIARQAVTDWGADIINDISAGTLDSQLWRTVRDLKVPYVMMHMRGTPATMQQYAHYNNVTGEVLEDMAFKLDELRQMGVNDIIADPGFGFAKTTEQNFELMRHLAVFHALEVPLLVGVSRKSMITKTLEVSSDEALNGTTVINTTALLNGAHILRVHDVKAAVEAVKLVNRLRETPDWLNTITTKRNRQLL